MASSITDLESQLIALTKRRVEIDSRWIEIQEKLLAASGSISDAEERAKVSLVSEMTEANPMLSATQTTNTYTQSPATRVKTNFSTDDIRSANPPRPIRPEVMMQAPPATTEVNTLSTSRPEGTTRISAPNTGPRMPPPSFPENSNLPLSQSSDIQAVRNSPHIVKSGQDTSPHAQSVALGNRQLLKPPQSSNCTQQDVHSMCHDVSVPFNTPGHTQSLFSHMLPRFP